jgi:hypothetical protein
MVEAAVKEEQLDGPGVLSKSGQPRHDNDPLRIEDIRIGTASVLT